MPRRTLTVVAALLAICASIGFYMGFKGTPSRARLPGEAVDGATGAALTATEITPLMETGDIPPPPPPVVKPDDKDANSDEVAEVTPPAKLEVDAPPLAVPPVKSGEPAKPAKPTEDKVGDLLDGVTPPPVDAPIF